MMGPPGAVVKHAVFGKGQVVGLIASFENHHRGKDMIELLYI